MILRKCSDLSSLYAIIRASPLYHDAFQSAHDELLTHVVRCELSARQINLLPPIIGRDCPYPKIEWLEYRLRPGAVLDDNLRQELNSAYNIMLAPANPKVPLELNVRQVKALRLLDDVVFWIKHNDHNPPALRDNDVNRATRQFSRKRLFHVDRPDIGLLPFRHTHDMYKTLALRMLSYYHVGYISNLTTVQVEELRGRFAFHCLILKVKRDTGRTHLGNMVGELKKAFPERIALSWLDATANSNWLYSRIQYREV